MLERNDAKEFETPDHQQNNSLQMEQNGTKFGVTREANQIKIKFENGPYPAESCIEKHFRGEKIPKHFAI